MDYYWIDAGWFGKGKWWKNPGDWRVKKDLYPEGFKPISDLLHASGRKLLLWFEPERVCAGTPWYTELDKWLLEVPQDRKVYRGFDGKGDWDVATTDPRWVPNESARNQIQEGDKLFNLAIPEARQFMTDFISAKIDEFGLDCFRNDANIAPLEFWRAADSPDRQGMTEIRWVEGFYAFWDELRRRHPNLIIDDCASGGDGSISKPLAAARHCHEPILSAIPWRINATAMACFSGCRSIPPLPGAFHPQ